MICDVRVEVVVRSRRLKGLELRRLARGWHVLVCCDEIRIDELFLDLLDFWVCECPTDPLTGSETQSRYL